jgi:hypothetical protein
MTKLFPRSSRLFFLKKAPSMYYSSNFEDDTGRVFCTVLGNAYSYDYLYAYRSGLLKEAGFDPQYLGRIVSKLDKSRWEKLGVSLRGEWVNISTAIEPNCIFMLFLLTTAHFSAPDEFIVTLERSSTQPSITRKLPTVNYPPNKKLTIPLTKYCKPQQFQGGHSNFKFVKTSTQKLVALKECKNVTAYHNFVYELQTLLLLPRHNNIITMLDYSHHESKQRVQLVLPIITGHSLFEVITNGHTQNSIMKEFTIATIMRQLLLALFHCHKNNVIHGDIKPSNIMISSINNKVTLIDFGCSQNEHSSSSEEQYLDFYTYGYMSPEQCLGAIPGYQKISGSQDIWASGMTMANMLTGDICLFEETNALSAHSHALMVMSMLGSPPLEDRKNWPDFVFAPSFPSWSNLRAQERLGAYLQHRRVRTEQHYKIAHMEEEISELAIDFTRQMLTTDLKSRPSASELLLHPFLH